MPNSTKIITAALLAFAAACGGSSGNAALSKSFSYGTPQPPTTTESQAATSAQSNLSQTTGFASQPDAAKGAAIVAFADTLAAAALGNAGIPLSSSSEGRIRGAVYKAADITTCTTVTATSVTFNNCSVTEQGFTVTITGSISVSASTVTWNISGGFSGVEQNVTINITHHQSGTFTVGSTSVVGNSVSDLGGTVSSQGQTVGFGVAVAAVVNLTYQATPYCVTGGSVEVKRVWTQRPQGASTAEFADGAVKITWTGCNAITVAHAQ